MDLSPVKFHKNYTKFVQNELALNREKSIKTISKNCENLFEKTNFEKDKSTRIYLFKEYEKIFKKDNYIKLTLNDGEIPYCYPFCPDKDFYKENILKNNIILLKLWKNYPQKFSESKLNNTVALPLTDVEYAEKIMKIFR